MTHIIKPLDRYVFSEFWRIFVTTALGFPVLVIIIDITDNLNTYLQRNLPKSQIALSYVYWLPDSMFMILPAAVLFATVFSIGALTRHSEITAAKASGISFYRFIAPIFAGALFAVGLGLVIGELAPHTNKRRLELLETQKFASTTDRYNFAYAGDAGRVYKISALHLGTNKADGVEIERKGSGSDYPSYIATSNTASYTRQGWVLGRGTLHLITGPASNTTFSYDSLYDKQFTEKPEELTASPKAPAEMDYAELGRFIRAMERSGTDVNELRVERMLKIAIPVTSLVILLFGAPLATSTQRGGAAYGVGVSLATTVIFLMLIQLTKAIGGKGLLPPELAAWLPSILFGIIGLALFTRVRT
ncbi:MAG: LptF/LptG family permease [Gemmatimonadota bacterium]|nr:LptF/LptG family permease [Gemmatimonadota bacterium]